MKKVLFICFAICCFLSFHVGTGVCASQFIDARLYMTDDPYLTLAWDGTVEGDSIPSRYDIEEIHIETNFVKQFSTPGLSIVVPKTKTGHFKYRIRACGIEEESCTVWVDSTDNEKAALWVDGAFLRQGGWIIYKQLSPIIIE